jgi:WD40 repeat protein
MILVRGLVESTPSEEVLLTGSGDGSVKLWRLGKGSNGAPVQWAKLDNGSDAVLSLAVDGPLLYCGLAGGALNIWNLDSHQMVKQITEHQGDLWSIDIIKRIAISGDSHGVFEAYLTCRNSTPTLKRSDPGPLTKAPCLHPQPVSSETDVSMQLVETTTVSLSGI